MSDKEICKELLEKILEIEIEKVEIVEDQKTIDLLLESKGIRLDVYAKGNLVKTIHKRVQEVKNDILMEVEFMTLLERDREKIEEGKIEGLKEIIQDNLREIGNVPQSLINSINEQNNIDILKSWNKISVIVKSFDEFPENIK